MNTAQIRRILQSDAMASDLYRGIYPIDRLPTIEPGYYIINTENHDEPGEHWLVVYNDNGQIEYFDSFGRPPLDKRLYSFLGSDYKYNEAELQQLFSNACGFYCVYYILHRVRGCTMEEIITILNRSDGDFIVKDFLYRRYKPIFV